MDQPLLISGLPRSGTTWVGKILSTAQGTGYVFEPDNEKTSPVAWLYKRDLHRFPYLTVAHNAPLYKQLWQTVFARTLERSLPYYLLERYFRQKTYAVEAHIGEKTGFTYIDGSHNGVAPSGQETPFRVQQHAFLAKIITRSIKRNRKRPFTNRLIVKSVHASLALGWLANHFDVTNIVVLRNPHSLYASYKRMRMPDGYRNLLLQSGLQADFQPYLKYSKTHMSDELAMQTTLMLKTIENQIKLHPNWLIISHDRLCTDPVNYYHCVFQKLGLLWTEETETSLTMLNQRGSGFDPARVAQLQPTKWRSELESEEVATLDEWVERLELSDFLNHYVY